MKRPLPFLLIIDYCSYCHKDLQLRRDSLPVCATFDSFITESILYQFLRVFLEAKAGITPRKENLGTQTRQSKNAFSTSFGVMLRLLK